MGNMKRIISMVALLLGFAVCAKAQLYVGGNLGLSTSSTDNETKLGVVIAPEIGYSFNSYFAIGSTVSYRSLQNTFGVSPYLRANVVNIMDVVRIYLTLQAPMHFASGYQSYGAFLRPGASVKVGPRVWIMTYLGAFGFSYTRTQTMEYQGWSGRLNANTVDIGFCFDLGN